MYFCAFFIQSVGRFNEEAVKSADRGETLMGCSLERSPKWGCAPIVGLHKDGGD